MTNNHHSQAAGVSIVWISFV